MEEGVRSMAGDVYESENVEPQATEAAANRTSGSWEQARKNSWEAGRAEDVGAGERSIGHGNEEEPLLREEVRYYCCHIIRWNTQNQVQVD